jgi:hypothetical protein
MSLIANGRARKRTKQPPICQVFVKSDGLPQGRAGDLKFKKVFLRSFSECRTGRRSELVNDPSASLRRDGGKDPVGFLRSCGQDS